MGKGRSKNKPGRGGGNFAMLPHYLLKSAAWRDLDTNARALYVEILFRFNGTNNFTSAKIRRSARSTRSSITV